MRLLAKGVIVSRILLFCILFPLITISQAYDGASDWPMFAEKSEQLLAQDECAAVFGCWTSVSRKYALPVFEKYNGLLFYPDYC